VLGVLSCHRGNPHRRRGLWELFSPTASADRPNAGHAGMSSRRVLLPPRCLSRHVDGAITALRIASDCRRRDHRSSWIRPTLARPVSASVHGRVGGEQDV
jgi:hypothetical protein